MYTAESKSLHIFVIFLILLFHQLLSLGSFGSLGCLGGFLCGSSRSGSRSGSSCGSSRSGSFFRLGSGRSECAGDGLLRTFGDAHTASLALLGINVCQVILYRDGVKLADLDTLATTDTRILTSLHCHSALILVDTVHPNATVICADQATFLAEFDDELGASLGARATSHTLLGVHFGETCLSVHVDRVELTRLHTIAQADTTKGATGLSGERSGSYGAALGSIIVCHLRARAYSTGTTYDSELRLSGGSLKAEDAGYLRHGLCATDGAHQTI
jgi:hypothetical protein